MSLERRRYLMERIVLDMYRDYGWLTTIEGLNRRMKKIFGLDIKKAAEANTEETLENVLETVRKFPYVIIRFERDYTLTHVNPSYQHVKPEKRIEISDTKVI